jgi:hypothetical protein
MRVLLVALLLLTVAGRAYAQHPCDTSPPPSGTVEAGKPYVLGWCQPALDDGATFKEYRGAVVTALVPVSGTVNASGQREYYISKPAETAAGTVVIELSAVNAAGMEGLKSVPFILTVVPRTPAAPTGLRVTQ